MKSIKIDMHIHTEYSKDSELKVDFIIERLKELGFHGMCITDHDTYEQGCPIEDYQQNDFLVLKGSEYSSQDGHILLYGIEDDSFMQWGKYQPAQKIINYVDENGGVAIPAHPYLDWYRLIDRKDGIPNPPKNEFDKVMQDKMFELENIIAVESLNGALINLQPTANDKAEKVRQQIGLKGIGGSDAHKDYEIGMAGTIFQDIEINCMKDLVYALKSKKCESYLMEL